MKKWSRRAAGNKGLVVLLVVVGIGAGGYWMWRYQSNQAELAERRELMSNLGGDDFLLYCPLCRRVYEYSPDEYQRLIEDMKGGRVRCPECGEYAAQRGEGDSMVEP